MQPNSTQLQAVRQGRHKQARHRCLPHLVQVEDAHEVLIKVSQDFCRYSGRCQPAQAQATGQQASHVGMLECILPPLLSSNGSHQCFSSPPHVQLLARFEQDKLAPWEGMPVARRAMLRYVQSAMARGVQPWGFQIHQAAGRWPWMRQADGGGNTLAQWAALPWPLHSNFLLYTLS